MKEASLFDERPEQQVQCRLCAHRCVIRPGRRGVCGVRENRDGMLYSLTYGSVVAESTDPIEKKPLFHVFPGTLSYSIASMGCNLQCVFCQNHEISQAPRERGTVLGRNRNARDIVDAAKKSGCRSIAYTYTEPTVFLEFARDVAEYARERTILNAFITNGYLTPEALSEMAPFLDAANVDLKSFSDGFYRRYCGARLQPVLDTLQALRDRSIWTEVTTLIIPTLNDDERELREMARFIGSLGLETPWHISRYHPCYKMHSIGATPAKTIERAREIGREEGLLSVYSGNLPGNEGEKTFCSGCGQLLIDRFGFQVRKQLLDGALCPQCKTPLAGIFEEGTYYG